jgi:spermidine dehydrogenase
MSDGGKTRTDQGGPRAAISRRDLLQGAAITVVASGLSPELAQAAAAERAAQDQPGYYPPLLNGLRGSHPGSFEAAHALRDGDFWKGANSGVGALQETGETYDLVVVGGGISGLSAAYFWRKARPNARILILDNHDDFGGHAKRNEFRVGGGLQLMNGGTLSIESPYPYSPVADGLLAELGCRPAELAKACAHPEAYRDMGLKPAVFFDRVSFGTEKLVLAPGREATVDEIEAFAAATPLSDAARKSLVAIETDTTDPMPGLSSAEKKDRLARISYRDYLLDTLKADPGVIPLYARRTDGLWGCGIDAVSALDCWGSEMPGFQGLKLEHGSTPQMGYTPAGFAETGGSYVFHYPDGNASIARMLVRSLVPGSLSGATAQDIVTATADYSRLDRPGNAVRIRLSSIVVRARNLGDPDKSRGVEVAYSRGGQLYRVIGRACVLASWNMMIPYLCPELPEPQRDALHQLVKTPLVYVSVAIRNWDAFHKLGISSVHAPGGYFSSVYLNPTIDIGGYTSPRTPDQPMVVHMLRTPAKPGRPEREQHKLGRYELLATPFDTFEQHVREQLDAILGPGGFDSERDIAAISVNRWPHGYAPEHNSLIDPDLPPDQRPNVIGRQRFGRISIANSDAGLAAYTDVAIDQAHRAVGEQLA